MTKKSIVNTQNIFLNNLRNGKMKVTIFLNNGKKLFGTIKGYDEFTIVLEHDEAQTLIYKSNIASIAPQSSIKPITDAVKPKTEDN